jgi:glycine reductase
MVQVRLMHYINQFFAGIGAEERADVPVGTVKGALGPGKRLQEILGSSAEIVVTAYCGDNYFSPHSQEVLTNILNIAKENKVDILVAGPAFASGRHGLACADVCHTVSTSLDIPCVGAMSLENPGVDQYRRYKDRKVYFVAASGALSGMEQALQNVATYITKLVARTTIGPASEEGYIPRGIRVNEYVNKKGADRAFEMLLSKLAGNRYNTEIPVEILEQVPVAPRITNLQDATIALTTTMGVIPPGNPDGFKVYYNNQWRKYSFEKLNSMQEENWEMIHGGYNSLFVLENPNYCVPLDASRELESKGAFEKLYPCFYMTSGAMGIISTMQLIGREIAADMKTEGVDATILVSA